MLLNQYKWDVKEFAFFEEQVKQEFNFMTGKETIENLDKMYESIILWMKQGWRPRHIEANTLKNYTAFGKAGFLKKDITTICNWCDALARLEKAIVNDEKLFKLKSEGPEEIDEFEREEIQSKWELFQQLLAITRKLRTKLVFPTKKPACLRF